MAPGMDAADAGRGDRVGLPLATAAASTASTISAAARARRDGPASARRRRVRPPLRFRRKAGRRRDRRDDADRDALALEERSLLDVQFDERRVCISAQPDVVERAEKPASPPDLVESPASRVRDRRSSAGIEPPKRRLPMQPRPNRVGSSLVNITSSIDRRGRKPAACSARMASSPPSTPTVPSYRPEWGWRRCASRSPRPAGPARSLPAREQVADRVLADRQPGLRAQVLEESARADRSVVGEEHAGHGRRSASLSSGQCVELGHDPVDVDLEVQGRHDCPPASGSRLTSL